MGYSKLMFSAWEFWGGGGGEILNRVYPPPPPTFLFSATNQERPYEQLLHNCSELRGDRNPLIEMIALIQIRFSVIKENDFWDFG